jgi:hypothetical protein
LQSFGPNAKVAVAGSWAHLIALREEFGRGRGPFFGHATGSQDEG